MTKKKDKKKKAKPAVQPEAIPELSNEQQKEQLLAVLNEATASGLPSAAAFKAMWKLSCVFSESGLFKRTKTPSACFVKIMYGHELGLSPMQSMINIDIVDGTPAMSGQMMLSLFERAGGKVEILERANDRCTVRMQYQDKPPFENTWTADDAKRAGLSGKDNHSNYPRAMLFWRVISDGIKVYAPGALMKAYTFGELTNERADDLAGYLDMTESVDVVPATMKGNTNKTSSVQSGKQTPAPTAARESKPQVASNQKIAYVRQLLDSPACPVPLKLAYEQWLVEHKNTESEKAVNKMIQLLLTFNWKDDKGTTQASDKQFGYLDTMVKGKVIPVQVKKEVSKRVELFIHNHGSFSAKQCSAWINCCQWFKDNQDKIRDDRQQDEKSVSAKKDGAGPDVKGDSPAEQLADNHVGDAYQKQAAVAASGCHQRDTSEKASDPEQDKLDQLDQLANDIEETLKKKIPESLRRKAIIMDYIDSNDRSITSLEGHLEEVKSWQDKVVDE